MRSAGVAAVVVLVAATALAGARAERAPASPRGSAVLVRFARTGGFIGVDDRLVVYRDGRAVSTRGAFRLSARQLTALRDALARARFATLRSSYGETCCDLFAFTIGYRGREVTVYEGATVPVRLRRLLERLNGLLFPRR